MTRAGLGATAAALALLAAGGAAAQGVVYDGQLAYSARDEMPDPDADDGNIDNDLFRATVGVSWSAGDGRMRGALEFGVRNEDFEDYPWLAGAELLFARRVGNQRYGIGARLRAAEDLSTTTEAAYAIQHLGTRVDLRGLVGVQLVSDADQVPGRGTSSAFGLGEVSLYATPNLALSLAVQGDADGAVYGVGAEYRGAGWGGFSLFIDYAEAFDSYRDRDGYDNLTAGLRFVPGNASLREKRQSSLGAMLRRYVEVQ